MELTPAVARNGITQGRFLFGPGEGHIKKPPFLLELLAGIQSHLAGKKVLFKSYDVDVGELQTFGSMDGHHRDFVVVAIVLVSIGQQRNVHEEIGHGVHSVRIGGIHLV